VGGHNKLHADILAFIAAHPKPADAPKEQWVICKLFDAFGSATWWLTEYDAEDKIGFGYVTGLQYDEWGSVSIDELAELHAGFTGMPGSAPRVEVDLHFRPTTKDEAVTKYYQNQDQTPDSPEVKTEPEPTADPSVLSLSE
jgi:hypothetical protein